MDPFEATGIQEDNLHPKFKVLRDDLQYTGEQEVLRSWVKGFEDRDGKLVKEFQTTFHSAFWEFYLFAVLKEQGSVVDLTKDRPDFVVKSPVEFNMEAVVAEIKQGGASEDTRNIGDILRMLSGLPDEELYSMIDEAIARYSNAIQSKVGKYRENYSGLDWINDDLPFVIALSSYSQINYGREYIYPALALLYGKYYNQEHERLDDRNEILKPGTMSPIPLGLFTGDAIREVSALVFCSTHSLGKLTSLSVSGKVSPLVLNSVFLSRFHPEDRLVKLQEVTPEHPEELTDGLFVFYNPNASKVLSKEAFSGEGVVHIYLQDGDIRIEGNFPPLMSRLNIIEALLPYGKVEFLSEAFQSLNPSIKVSVYRVSDIDSLSSPCEMTLFDELCDCPVVVDLSEEGMAELRRQGISENDRVAAIIKKHVNSDGIVVSWSLVDIERK